MIYCDSDAFMKRGECPCRQTYTSKCDTCDYPHNLTDLARQHLRQELIRRQQEQMEKLGGNHMKTVDTVSSYPPPLHYTDTDSLASPVFALTQTEAECIVSLTSNAMAQKFGVSIMEVLPVIRATLQPYIR